ncbi:unnamed protein product [Symbiodinium sp. KB8]|nr:unnamed protein product [Symbiodinium sp. KB8]
MQGAELLRKSIMVLLGLKLPVKIRARCPKLIWWIGASFPAHGAMLPRTREVFSLVDDAINRYKDPASFSYTSTACEGMALCKISSIPSPHGPQHSGIAAQQLERAADDVAGISRKLDEAKDVDSLRAELAELSETQCQRTISSLRERAAELQHILKATEGAYMGYPYAARVHVMLCYATRPNETQIEEENLDDLRTGVLDDGWARTAEPEAAPSQSLHVTGLLQGIEESTLQRCFGRAGKVEEIRFLPQDQAMASRCSAMVRMSSCDEAKVAREKLDGIIPEGTGFEMERNLMITFQVKNGIQVCDHLFVRGIPSAVQKHQVASLFNRYGEVLWSSILPPRMDEQDRCALVQMASSDQAQNAIQALNWTTSSALMPAMMVRYAGHKVFAALRDNDDGIEEADQGSEEEEDDDDYAHYGVIEEAPKPAFQPLKERPVEMGSRWKKHEEADDDGPEGTRLWGWAMQPVKEKKEFPELGQQNSAALPDDSEPKLGQPVQQVQNGYPGQVESWEELEVEQGPCEFLCMKDAPSGLPESVMQMWFKPYGHVVEMRPLWRASTPGRQAFLVHMSCVEEAINAVEALNGKSIMKGKPLLLEYWHGPVDDAEEPPQESSAATGIDKSKLLEAVRAMGKKKSSPEAAQSTLNGTQTMQPGPCTGISDAQLLEACRAALAKRKARATEVAPWQPSTVPADAVEEEAPVVEEAALQEEAQDEKAIQEDDDDKESWEAWASDDETGRQMWFKPHGQVRQFRALTPAETGLDKTKQEKARRGPGQGTAVASVLKRKQEAKAELAKRAKAEAAKMLPPAVPKTAGAESKEPEEAEVPEAKDAEQIPAAADKEITEPLEEEDAEQEEAMVGPLAAPAESQQLKATGTLSAAPAEAPKPAEAEAEEGQDDQALPEGFFDDPEQDAKVRGMEAPSRKAEREIEEGLRRFEREMAAEQEKAEETRHAIDEKKYEALAAEEEEFQTQLESRLVKLRQAASERKKGMDGADAPFPDVISQGDASELPHSKHDSEHALELTEPAISRTALFEGKLREVRVAAERNADNLKQLHQKLSSQDGLKKTIDSFRSELGEWDRERRDHEHLLNEKTCLQDNELSALRKMIEVQAYSTEACQRGLKNVGDLLAATKDEVTQLRDYCCDRVDVNRDKIMKLRDEVESKFAASESTQFKLHDDVTNMATVFAHLKSEMERIGLVTAETMESVADLWRAKASASSVEEQQQTFMEFQRNLNDAVASLRLRVNSVVDEVKGHFQTAVRVISTSTSKQIDTMRTQYAEDIGRMDEVMQQNASLSEILRGSEDQAKAHLQQLQEDLNKQMQELRVGLAEKVKVDPVSEQYVLEVQQLRRAWKDHQENLAGHDRFKIACLNYTPGPVEYHQVSYSRAELLHLQAKLLDQAQDRMHRAAGV